MKKYVLRAVLVYVLLLLYGTCNAEQIYNIKNYGILPNGEAIDAKLASLTLEVSRKGGGVILFDNGIYIFDLALTTDGTPTGGVRLYRNVTYRGNNNTILKVKASTEGFHSMFGTADNSVENVVFENLTFDTYIGTNNRNTNDYRLAIALHWCKNITIRNCKFIHDIGTIDTRYSHKQEDKNIGEYGVDGLIVENCIFEARLLKESGYRDITSFGICAQNVIIRNNRFYVPGSIKKRQNKFYPNCCIELQGRDMWIYGNEFNDFSNAIDFTTSDTFAKCRNINIYDNRFYTYRGVALWCGYGQYVKGLNISRNYFKHTFDNEDKRVTGTKGSIMLVSHPTDSYNGSYLDILINGNEFDRRNENDFLTKKKYEDWIKDAQHKTDEKSGYYFEEYYSTIDLGGVSKIRDNIFIVGNVFIGGVFPCIYVGGRNISTNHYLIGNEFIDCCFNSNYGVISLNNNFDGVEIKRNKVITSNKAHNAELYKINMRERLLNDKTSNLIQDVSVSNNDTVYTSKSL